MAKNTKQTFNGDFPAQMRSQLWPLCCGASIISGFKEVAMMDPEELVTKINSVINDELPDFQVFGGEQMRPALTFLTLNNSQMSSPKIMTAVAKAGFVKIGEGKPRGSPQGFFVRDTSNTFKTEVVEPAKALAAG